MPDSDYWATVAQVLPVFALAVVVEARAISQRWTSETSKLFRYALSATWAVTLAVLAFGELAALRALRGEQVSAWWALLMENAVAVAISVLVTAPAVDFLVKGYAEGFARLATGGWFWRLRLVGRQPSAVESEWRRLREGGQSQET